MKINFLSVLTYRHKGHILIEKGNILVQNKNQVMAEEYFMFYNKKLALNKKNTFKTGIVEICTKSFSI